MAPAGTWVHRKRRGAHVHTGRPRGGVQRASVLLVAAGIALAAAGLGIALGVGWGIAAAGVACGGLGLALERRPDPDT